MIRNWTRTSTFFVWGTKELHSLIASMQCSRHDDCHFDLIRPRTWVSTVDSTELDVTRTDISHVKHIFILFTFDLASKSLSHCLLLCWKRDIPDIPSAAKLQVFVFVDFLSIQQSGKTLTFLSLFSYRYLTKAASSSLAHCSLRGSISTSSFSAERTNFVISTELQTIVTD